MALFRLQLASTRLTCSIGKPSGIDATDLCHARHASGEIRSDEVLIPRIAKERTQRTGHHFSSFPAKRRCKALHRSDDLGSRQAGKGHRPSSTTMRQELLGEVYIVGHCTWCERALLPKVRTEV